MKLLYLHRELMPYNLPVFEHLIKKEVELLIVHDNRKKMTPYQAKIDGARKVIGLAETSKQEIWEESLSFDPDVVFICDRTISIYNKISFHFKNKQKLPVIIGNDTQWRGGKQWYNVLTRRMRFLRCFTHIMVSGFRQFEYAKKLGFKNNQILWPVHSANTTLFEQLVIDKERYNVKDFLFVGRFNKVKGIKYLLKAWQHINHENGEKLHLIGNGEDLPSELVDGTVIVHEFSDQVELLEVAKKCRSFILPSIFEPWGMVIHEFAAAGMPLILSDACGAANHFLINNYNGFLVEPASVQSLVQAIQNIKDMPPEELETFGQRSRKLSYSINPEMVACNILSVYNS